MIHATWPITVLASSYDPHPVSQGVMMAICVGYVALEAGPATMTVAGLVSPKRSWRDLDERWLRVLRREGLNAFDRHEFARSGEPAEDRTDDQARRRRLLQPLAALVDQHVAFGCSCSIPIEDYDAVNAQFRLSEEGGGIYAVCAAAIVAIVGEWIAERHADDLTLFVFEDGLLHPREIRRILAAHGIVNGEPFQIWPRQWTDNRGRRRYLRPFEACDLLMLASDVQSRLTRRDAYRRVTLDRDHLMRVCGALSIPRRITTNRAEGWQHA